MITMGEFNMKKISLVLACVAVVSVLVGCGGVSQSEYDTVKNELETVKTQYSSVCEERDN